MASGKSAFLERALLDHVLGRRLYTPPESVFVGLSASAGGYAATGSVMNEVIEANYARRELANDATVWPGGVGSGPCGKSVNSDVLFPVAATPYTVRSVYLLDAATGGNALYWTDLDAPFLVEVGKAIAFDAGMLTVREF